ncbi:hypothetical protein N665_0549s0024 [Sinapis alba]|nr:hypothetical protein N665_0549s0024 [Sinapis alba]
MTRNVLHNQSTNSNSFANIVAGFAVSITALRLSQNTSVELLETVGCFLELHEMRLCPKKVQSPPVDRLVSLQPAQSLSL